MKKYLLSIAIASVTLVATANASEVNEKAVNAFKKAFATANKVSWSQTKDYATVSFYQDNVQHRAVYNKKGKLVRSIRYYDESCLMPSILENLKENFEGKAIKGITELTVRGNTVFQANLCDDQNWYIVRADTDGNVELFDQFKRADL